MNNLAAVRQLPAAQRHPGVLLYHEALFASHKATNTALSLMREAMTLPLPCSNVIQKVVQCFANMEVDDVKFDSLGGHHTFRLVVTA